MSTRFDIRIPTILCLHVVSLRSITQCPWLYARDDIDLLPLRLLCDTFRQLCGSRLNAATWWDSCHNNLNAITR
jgi:hypothetical protein